jgi:hypothetical protein
VLLSPEEPEPLGEPVPLEVLLESLGVVELLPLELSRSLL